MAYQPDAVAAAEVTGKATRWHQTLNSVPHFPCAPELQSAGAVETVARSSSSGSNPQGVNFLVEFERRFQYLKSAEAEVQSSDLVIGIEVSQAFIERGGKLDEMHRPFLKFFCPALSVG